MNDSEMMLAILRDVRDSIGAFEKRLSAKIDAKIDALDHKLSSRIDELDERVSGRLDRVENRLGLVENTLSDLASQMLFLGRYVKNKLEPKSG